MSINYVTRRDNGLKKIRKGGGSGKSPHGFQGGYSKVHDGPQGGRGGQKCPKIGPHGLRMTPKTNFELLQQNEVELFVEQIWEE